MTIDSQTRRDLKRIAHHLKPVVTVAGDGLSDGVRNEIERALRDHELIKVKLALADREQRTVLAAELCTSSGAERIADIGKVLTMFRANPRANPKLSNLQRTRPTKA